MGEVYRARDTRLSRNVAIKVLPAEFARDVRLRVRLDREANGRYPLWSFDGREVFYRSGNDIFTVPLSISGSRLLANKPRLLFSLPTFWSYDVVPDGFVISREASARSAIGHVNVVLNWKQALTSLMR